ncbi:MAG: hypothetical protein ACT4QD_26440 [Acidobacteriota bacterium]
MLRQVAWCGVVVGVLVAGGVRGQVPQNPSPMSDSTRPHMRVSESRAPGLRISLPLGDLYVSERFGRPDRAPLIVHFHGAPWLIEHHVRRAAPGAALVAVNLGAGSARYATAFADPGHLSALLQQAADAAASLTGRRPSWRSVTLTSFSAGYGAIRAILQDTAAYDRVDAVLLADGLHASYVLAGDPAAPRATDPPVDQTTLDPFIRLAKDAAAGRKRLWVTHSEVYPGTYASTTDTANVLLASTGLTRRPILRAGPIGMQQLSVARQGGLLVLGFAGNSAPDHLDHLYALGDWLKDWKVGR